MMPLMKAVREFVTEFQWIHDAVGNFGNLCFVVGSVFFLWNSLKIWGVWLFIFGSFGMMVGSMGATLVRWEHRIRHDRDIRRAAGAPEG